MSSSRWLVGSSRIRRSDGVKTAATKAALFFCPPESCAGCSEGSAIPKRCSMTLTSPSVSQWDSLPDTRAATFSRIVRSSSKTGFCGRQETFNPFDKTILPSSGSSSPDASFKKVDFPVPLIPITPTLSCSSMPNETPRSTGLMPKFKDTLSKMSMLPIEYVMPHSRIYARSRLRAPAAAHVPRRLSSRAAQRAAKRSQHDRAAQNRKRSRHKQQEAEGKAAQVPVLCPQCDDNQQQDSCHRNTE